ncbi:MAG: O-antigen ligase C-terminal domain-containing protein [Gammaproteobacteria bacterium]|nr:hypothetical protein [Rhodocyclaceae bacterium]MBU3989872.1 O-antigen ligase C-terminal domain-containing protein [Gammaproteobacteria bacterium]MBU4019937.1 O-antigen ligase C-terminal domain-containing protein [Gammaproteobacteria bacterium]
MGPEPTFRPTPIVGLFCLGLLALMASGPFLWPFHSQPIPSFWSEWWAGALGLAAAFVLLIGGSRNLPLPALLGIPAVLLLVLLLQFMLGRLAFAQIGLLHTTYLLWAGLLLILGRHLAATVGLPRLAAVLACAFALGALAGAAIAIAQWFGITAGVPWIFPHLGGGVYANLGQANHHAHYSWLGIASLFYLRGRGWLSRPLLWLIVLPIALGSVLGGSRSVLLYPIIILVAIILAKRRAPNGTVAPLLADALLLLPAVVVLSFLGSWLPPGGAAVTSVERLYQSVDGSSVRLAVARAAWSAFLDHPWLGQGVGNYAWASFMAAAGPTGAEPLQVAENAHNFILHGIAEFGILATGVVVLLLGMWARRFFQLNWELEQFWCAAVLGIGAAHALLEYPLWYAYFLGPAALLLGASDTGKTIILSGRRTLIYLSLATLGGASILAGLRADYAAIERVSYQPLAAHADRERAWRISMDQLTRLHRESLLAPWALMALTNLSEPSRLMAQERATLCERGIRFSPARPLVSRCAIQLAIAGRQDAAIGLTRAVLRAYPTERAATVDELSQAASEYPEVMSLLRIGQQS